LVFPITEILAMTRDDGDLLLTFQLQ
jgi:hypothetical protein